MTIDDRAALGIMRRAMVARIATLSRNARPSVTPIYFIYRKGHIWLGTSSWTLAAREVQADPRVCVLLNVEQNSRDQRTLRITGLAQLRREAASLRSYNLRAAFKYVLKPAAMFNRMRHWRQHLALHSYHAQNAEKGGPCIIDVTPEQVDFLN